MFWARGFKLAIIVSGDGRQMFITFLYDQEHDIPLGLSC